MQTNEYITAKYCDTHFMKGSTFVFVQRFCFREMEIWSSLNGCVVFANGSSNRFMTLGTDKCNT